ncbi:MAG: ChaN family lipoprotein [Synechococcales bacterium]|nr:ChaN family lipoprotein [Synechococcales bacterium]
MRHFGDQQGDQSWDEQLRYQRLQQRQRLGAMLLGAYCLGVYCLGVYCLSLWSGGSGAIAEEQPHIPQVYLAQNAPFVVQTPTQYLQTQGSPSQRATSPAQSLDAAKVLDRLATLQVVYLGETHDQAEDHELQLAIIQALYQRQPKLVIAMEMFQRPYQSAIDRFLGGEIDTNTLLRQTEYEKRWGFPWQFYEPIVQFAKQKQIPVIALNVPTEVTRKVGRKGLTSLTIAERRFIPPLSAIEMGPEPYQTKLRELYDSFHSRKGSQTGFHHFFQAQVLWDETMAERISQILQQQPDRLVVVLAGQGHVWEGHGIPRRVARRLSRSANLQQSIILLTPDAELLQQLTPTSADYLWDAMRSPQPIQPPENTTEPPGKLEPQAVDKSNPKSK